MRAFNRLRLHGPTGNRYDEHTVAVTDQVIAGMAPSPAPLCALPIGSIARHRTARLAQDLGVYQIGEV
jgi:hypothetical protein